jgi:hypothetical protein
MKLASIRSVMIGCGAAAGILASTSPAHALTWTLQNVTFFDYQGVNTTNTTANGYFDYDGTNYSNVNITVSNTVNGGEGYDPETLTDGYFNPGVLFSIISSSSDTGLTLATALPEIGYPAALQLTFSSGLSTVTSIGQSIELKLGFKTLTELNTFYGYNDGTQAHYQSAFSGSVTAVPFEVPGGATIPTVGSLFALGVMRSAKKRIAFKTRIANPMSEAVS